LDNTHDSNWIIVSDIKINDSIPITWADTGDTYYNVTGQENIYALGKNILCWILYDKVSNSTYWYDIESGVNTKAYVNDSGFIYKWTLVNLEQSESESDDDDDNDGNGGETIPGYTMFFLLWIVAIVSAVLAKKRFKKLNGNIL